MISKYRTIFTRTALVFLACFSLLSCNGNQLKQENDFLKEELESTQLRLNSLELYVNELQEQVVDKDMMMEEETKRIEETYLQLNNELIQEIEKGQVEIANIKGVLTINIVETVFFDSGSAEIKEEGKPVLLRIGKLLKALPEKLVRIEGHTDNVPIGEKIKEIYPSNWELGAIRAVKVVRFLADEAKIDPKRLAAVSYSQYRPIKSNKTAEGRKKNRRIEIVVLNKQLYQLMETKKGLETTP